MFRNYIETILCSYDFKWKDRSFLCIYFSISLLTSRFYFHFQPHVFCKVISEFALEYRTVRQRVLDQKRKKEDHRKRTKTRGKLITESGAYGNVEVQSLQSFLSFDFVRRRYQMVPVIRT